MNEEVSNITIFLEYVKVLETLNVRWMVNAAVMRLKDEYTHSRRFSMSLSEYTHIRSFIGQVSLLVSYPYDGSLHTIYGNELVIIEFEHNDPSEGRSFSNIINATLFFKKEEDALMDKLTK